MTFQGALQGTDVAQVTVNASAVLSSPTETESTGTPGSSQNEVQTVGFNATPAFTSGTFTLTFDGQTTSALDFDATASEVDTALEALSNIGTGDISVVKTVDLSGDQQWQVTFAGTLAATDVTQITVDASNVDNGVGPPSVVETTDTAGSSVNEVQSVGFATDPPFVSGTFTLTFGGQTTSALDYDATASEVEADLEALSNIGSGDVSVSKTIDSSGQQEWQIAFQGNLAGTDVSQVTVDATNVDNGVGSPTEIESTGTEGFTILEQQTVTLNDSTGGTFTLRFDGQLTAALDFDATAGEVESALEALEAIENVSVSGSNGGPFTITFGGSLSGNDVSQVKAEAAMLTNTELLRAMDYEYDEFNQLRIASDPSATYEFEYDHLGRVISVVQNIAGLNPEIEFQSFYDDAGNREKLQAVIDSTDDFKNLYTYDALNRLTMLTQESPAVGNTLAEKRFDFIYNTLSQYSQIDRYADVAGTEYVASSHYRYDGLGRVTKILHTQNLNQPISDWGSDALAGYAYKYDAASRITSILSMLDGLSSYDYDDTNQLTGADHADQDDETYEYDANGNRDMGGYVIDPNNRLKFDGVFTYLYDDEGNRTAKFIDADISGGISTGDSEITAYTWDHRNRLTAIKRLDDESNVLSVTEQTYDVFNQWIRRSVDDDGPGVNDPVDTFFVYENGQIVLQFDGDEDTDLSHRYLWGSAVDQLLADENVTSLSSAGDLLWPLGDHLDTVRDIAEYDSGMNETSVINHRVFDSFGNVVDETNDAVDMLFEFTARPLDESTGLQNNLNRWYDENSGNWLGEDPSGFAGNDVNISRYVHNSPLVYIDPTGLVPNETDTSVTLNDSVTLRKEVFFPFNPPNGGYASSPPTGSLTIWEIGVLKAKLFGSYTEDMDGNRAFSAVQLSLIGTHAIDPFFVWADTAVEHQASLGQKTKYESPLRPGKCDETITGLVTYRVVLERVFNCIKV